MYQPEHQEQHEVTHANFIFKTIPKEGYSFGSWMLNDKEVSGDYTVTTKDDVTVVPVLSKTPGPQPTPDPDDPTNPTVKPTSLASTGDIEY